MAAVLPSLLLFAYFLMHGAADSSLSYGPGILQRLLAVLRADPLGTIGRETTLSGMALTFALLVLVARQLFKLREAGPAMKARERDLSLEILAVAVSFVLLLLIIPDQAGGGWTHVWRAEAFPYIGLVLAAAPIVEHRTVRALALGAGTLAGLVVLAMVAKLQLVDSPPVIREFEAADRMVGPHCTVAPVVFGYKLDQQNTARLVHHPLFHIASRFELKDDRVVLFNYLARLPIYAVRFRTGTDPQQLIYHWMPGQSDTAIYRVDIGNFENATGIPIDYVLIWGPPGPEQMALWQEVHGNELGDYKLVHRSGSGRLELYRRMKPGGCGKAAE
jgi:hypothetical protein